MGASKPVPRQAEAQRQRVGVRENAAHTLPQSRASGTARSSPPFQRRGSEKQYLLSPAFAGRLAKARDFNPASTSLTILIAALSRTQVFEQFRLKAIDSTIDLYQGTA